VRESFEKDWAKGTVGGLANQLECRELRDSRRIANIIAPGDNGYVPENKVIYDHSALQIGE
jgi:hypothetical protein